ncbi:MAG TPA: hypothetical protein DCR55_00425 [Lentisphaeria bacterium]|nr:hypothetical protein [Lentisphaeria bacterium]
MRWARASNPRERGLEFDGYRLLHLERGYSGQLNAEADRLKALRRQSLCGLRMTDFHHRTQHADHSAFRSILLAEKE